VERLTVDHHSVVDRGVGVNGHWVVMIADIALSIQSSYNNLRHCSMVGRCYTKYGDSDSSRMHYGLKMFSLRNHAKYLIVLASALTMLLVVACGASKDGFRDGPRVGGQLNDLNPVDDFQNDFAVNPPVEDSSQPAASGNQADIAEFDGQFPGRYHGDKTHWIWP